MSLNWKGLQRRVRTARELAGEDHVPPRLDPSLTWCRECATYVSWATFDKHRQEHRKSRKAATGTPAGRTTPTKPLAPPLKTFAVHLPLDLSRELARLMATRHQSTESLIIEAIRHYLRTPPPGTVPQPERRKPRLIRR